MDKFADANAVNPMQHVRWLWFLSLLALLARIGFLTIFGGLDEGIYDSMSDQYIYMDIGRNLATYGQFVVSSDTWVADAGKPTSIVPPLYPLFVSLNFQIFGETLVSIRLLQTMLSLVLVVTAYVIGYKVFNKRTGIIAGVIVALYPPLVMYIRPIMSEGLFFPLVALLAWITYGLMENPSRVGLYPAWGFIAALALLTRSEALLLDGLLLLYLIHWTSKRRSGTRLALYGISLLVFLISVLPYAWFNYLAHGKFSPFPNAKWKFWDHTWWAEMRQHTEWQGVSLPERLVVPEWGEKTESERDAYLWDMGIRFICENPGIFLLQRVKQLYWQYPLVPLEEIPPPLGNRTEADKPDGYEYGPTSLDDVVRYITPAEKLRVWSFRLVAISAGLGVFRMVHRKRQKGYWLILIVLWNIICAVVFVGSERLRLSIDVFLIILSAYFIDNLLASLRRQRCQQL